VHTKTKDVKISYDFRWQRLHWMSLSACYRRSAYFEFYEDFFAPFYHQHFVYLTDYNEQLLSLILKLSVAINFTNEYQKSYLDIADYRYSIHPKKNPSTKQKPYFQVFEDRKDFLKDLSVVDLLFNQGPQAINYL